MKLHNQIVELLKSLPNISDSAERRALIFSASLDEVEAQIEFEGTTEQFCQLLVHTLARYGTLQDGRNAFEAVLQAAKGKVGQEKREYCDSLIQQILGQRFDSLIAECNRKILPTAPVLDFSDRMHELTQVFVGRDWLLREVDDFLAQAQDRYLVITGEPGIGKSAFAAYLTQKREIHVYHFCIVTKNSTLNPSDFVRSLNYQLASYLPGFLRYVLEQGRVRIEQGINIQKMESENVYGVYVEKVISQAQNVADAFQYLICNPLKDWSVAHPKKQVMLLVDALDEASRMDYNFDIVDLIKTTQDLPIQVRWILTSRPGEHLFDLPGARVVIIDDSDDNMRDVRSYVSKVLTEPILIEAMQSRGISATELSDELMSRSEGNFLYLHYIFDALRETAKAKQPLLTPDQLPIGLNGVYCEFLNRLLRHKKADWKKVYRSVLGVLTVAQEALTFEQLTAFSEVDDENVNDVINELGEFLNLAVDSSGFVEWYRIYHASFGDFLTDRKRSQTYWVNPGRYHRQIAEYLLAQYSSDWITCKNEYGLRHLPNHLFEAICYTDQKSNSVYNLLKDNLKNLLNNKEFLLSRYLAIAKRPKIWDEELWRKKDFTDIKWAFQKVESWLKLNKRNVFILTGSPGSGKTTLVAKLYQMSHGDNLTSEIASGNLITIFLQGSNINPVDLTEIITHELAKQCESYARALVQCVEAKIINIQFNSTEYVRRIRNIVGEFIRKLSIEDALQRIFIAPLNQLYTEGFDKNILIVFDALDETPKYHLSQMTVLLRYIRNLSGNVHLLITTRDDLEEIHILNGAYLDLSKDALKKDK